MDRILCLLVYLLAAASRLPIYCRKEYYDKWEPGKKRKILLVGYNGARNTGSDVRVAAIAKQVRNLWSADEAEITVMTLDEKSLEGYFDKDVRLLSFTTLFPLSLFKACSSHHAAILCEGSTLKSKFANGLTLFLCEAAGVMAGQRKPCIAYGSEVGEMEPFLARAASKLCRNTYFITRTQSSLEALKKLGLKGHAGTDAAWSYDGAITPEEADRLLREQGWDGRKPLLGIAVINPFCWPVRASLGKWIRSIVSRDYSGQYDKWYYFSDTKERRAAYRTYIEGMAEGAAAFIQKHDCFPVLIGMERLDEKACKAVREKLPVQGAMFLSDSCSADIMTGILRRLAFLLTSRYHAAVLSMENGCPIVAVSMDERLEGIMQELSLDQSYLLKAEDPTLADRIPKALEAAFENQEGIHRHIRDRLPQYKDELRKMGIFMKQYIDEKLEKRPERR